jgi:hypothetical protein
LKVSCRRAASFRSASSISWSGSPEASVHSTGTLSRTMPPPSSRAAGTPSVRPTASSSAVSMAALAAALRLAAASMRAPASSKRSAGRPISDGAMWASMLALMLSTLSSLQRGPPSVAASPMPTAPLARRSCTMT